MSVHPGELVIGDAYGRGRVRGIDDRNVSPVPNLSPLSGEWAGESVRELLGDLVDELISIGWDDEDAEDIVCDSYETGYVDGFGPVPDVLSVCPDCFDWFAAFAGATESPDREMPAGVAYWDNPARFVIECLETSDCFSWSSCDTCRTTLGGPRYDVAVFDSGENPAG